MEILFLRCHAGIIREREDRHEIKSPLLFIFAENDDYIPVEQVGRPFSLVKRHLCNSSHFPVARCVLLKQRCRKNAKWNTE